MAQLHAGPNLAITGGPSFVLLACNEGFTGLALGIEGIEVLF
jgi:hypothetical protein